MRRLAGRSILIVDRDTVNLGTWRQRLLGEGARVICSSSLDSALANAIAFPAGTFHAVLIEHRPPGLDAIELAAALRALPNMRGLSVIVIGDPGERPGPVEAPPDGTAWLARPGADEQVAARLAAGFEPISVPRRHVEASPLPRRNYRGTVLVAEDDPVNAEIMCAMLVALGLDVVHVRNGAEAIGRATQQRFDLILMDAEMPVIDGLEATRRIRAHEVAADSRQPIACVTANQGEDFRAHCLVAGMDDLITKPVGIAALVAVLARWLATPGQPNARERTSGDAEYHAPVPDAAKHVPVPAPADPIDWSQVESLRSVDRGGAGGIVGKAIGLYIDHAPRLIQEILTYRVTGDLKDVMRAAHSLRASSASLGAEAVARLSATIESAAAKSDFEVIDSVAAALQSEYRRAESALRGAL